MASLRDFRNHCRRMATAQHRLDCTGANPTPARWALPDNGSRLVLVEPAKPATCFGECLDDRDRELFKQLADEADAYLEASP